MIPLESIAASFGILNHSLPWGKSSWFRPCEPSSRISDHGSQIARSLKHNYAPLTANPWKFNWFRTLTYEGNRTNPRWFSHLQWAPQLSTIILTALSLSILTFVSHRYHSYNSKTLDSTCLAIDFCVLVQIIAWGFSIQQHMVCHGEWLNSKSYYLGRKTNKCHMIHRSQQTITLRDYSVSCFIAAQFGDFVQKAVQSTQRESCHKALRNIWRELDLSFWSVHYIVSE